MKDDQRRYDTYLKDLKVSHFNISKSINSVVDLVNNNEMERNYKMQVSFDKEKSEKLKEQEEIQEEINKLTKNNNNEKLINNFNAKINHQKQLYDKYTQMLANINSKIEELDEFIPEIDKILVNKSEKLKSVNKENLQLMEKITQLEKEKTKCLNNLSNMNNINLQSNVDTQNKNEGISYTNTNISNNNNIIINSNTANSNNLKKSDERLSTFSNTSSNIQKILDENEDVRVGYNNLLNLRKMINSKKKENENLSKEIMEMNSDHYNLKKIFNEGMHEIAKELLKIHEIQLDKIINYNNNSNLSNSYNYNSNNINSNSSNNNSNLNYYYSSRSSHKEDSNINNANYYNINNNVGSIKKNNNNLYFNIVQSNINGNEAKNDKALRLPIIRNNIMRKYNFPIVEKANSNTLVYQAIKNMLDENTENKKMEEIKKNKFTWEEFKNFSAYQVFTILNLDKELIKKIEGLIFPRSVVVPNEDKINIGKKNKTSEES